MIDSRVTIITPVKATRPEHVTWLHEAIASVMAQTVSVMMIIVDDHSTVNLDPVREQWPDVTWLEAEGEGCAAARNQAARAATTELLLPLDADDKLTPEAVASFLRVWDEGDGTGIVYSDVVMFGQDYAKMYIAPGYDFRTLLQATFMLPCCLHRRADWKRVGGWRIEMEIGLEDWEYWIALGEIGVCGRRVPEPLVWYRRHTEGRLARLKRDPTRWQRAYQRMRDLHSQSYNGRFPMGCCGGASPAGARHPRRVPAARAEKMVSPSGERVMIVYTGNRMGDFGVTGQVSRVRYHVPGKNMLVEDVNGKQGVDARDVQFLLSLNQGRDFKRVSTPAQAPALSAQKATPQPVMPAPAIVQRAVEVQSVTDDVILFKEGMPPEGEPILATDGARKLAAELGIELASITGSGVGGKVVMADVKRMAE